MKKYSGVIKYGLVGISAFSGEFLSFLALMYTLPLSDAKLIIAQCLSFCVGLAISFIGNRQYTFLSQEGYDRRMHGQLIIFGVLSLVNLFLTNVGLWLLINNFDIRLEIAKLMIMCVIVLWNYILMKIVIFRKKI
jgi:putative flippase GtrA